MQVKHKMETHKVYIHIILRKLAVNGLAMIIVHLVDCVYIETVAGSGPLVLKLPHSLIIISIILVSYIIQHCD